MRINHNIQALNAYRNLSFNQSATSKNLEKLSSGLRINKASDDAAGLAISEKMRSQIRGLDQAERNALDGISLIQTAEGAMNTTHSILQRMRELAVQASNDTLTADDRKAIQDEVDQLTFEIDSIAENTQFNKKQLLAGAVSGRPYAETNAAAQIQYKADPIDPTTKSWNGVFHADPSAKGGFDLQIGSALGDATALEGTVIEVNGIKYELDGAGDGVAGNNVLVDVKGFSPKAATDATEQARLDDLAGRIKNAIVANDPSLEVKLINSTNTSDTADNGIVDSAKLEIRTKDGAAPQDFLANGKYESLQKVNASGGDSADLVFADITGTSFVPDGTNANTQMAKKESTQPKSIDVTFSEVPKAGDALQIDGYTFTFSDNASEQYAAGQATYNISVQDKKTGDILTEIKTILDAGTADGDVKLAALSGIDVISPTTLSLSTLKTNDGAAFQADGSANGLEVRLLDNDFEETAGTDLTLSIQTGANEHEDMEINIATLDAASLGLARDGDHKNGNTFLPGMNAVTGVDVSNAAAARNAITTFDNAIIKVSEQRSKLGAFQNRLEHKVNYLKIANENATSAESRIRDVDMAKEMTEFTKNNILNQSAQAMLAQANQLPQGVLQLLK